MTDTVKERISKALEHAKDRTEKTRGVIRRNRLAYLGLHGLAYERAKESMAQLRTARNDLFMDFLEKGEDMEDRATEFFSGAKEKAEDVAEDISEAAWKLTPGETVNRVEDIELAVKTAKEDLKKIATPAKKTAAKTPAKKTAKASKPKTAATVQASVKTAKTDDVKSNVKVEASAKPEIKAETPKAVAKPKTPAKPKAKKTPTIKINTEEPRHIPYFNDVKRYDPLASEDVVRKIVNHCGIALQSADARLVACTDEAERNRVRDSWMKKTLGLTASDADLDKKVQNICAVMQRDNFKNRVTFYYLIAKAERKLGDL